MILNRLAILTLDKKDAECLRKNFHIKIEFVEITMLPVNQKVADKTSRILHAAVPITGLPLKSQENKIIVPNHERILCENVIDSIANLLAVSEGCKRSLSSPFPCVTFTPETEDELDWLNNSDGLMGRPYAVPDTLREIEINEGFIRNLLDRLDGVALLSEALSCDHATGKYKDYIRLFERAFARGSSQLEKQLYKFLSESRFGYDRQEISTWLSFRDAAMHADGKKTNEIILESDVIKYMPRMQQACYDVLLNKEKWHDFSSHRRDVWSPPIGTDSKDNDYFITQGTGANLNMQLFDDYQAYPMNLAAVIQQLPAGMWSKRSEVSPISGRMTVLARNDTSET